MAIYVPASRRRRNTIVLAVVAVVAGLVLGFLVGRTTSPSLADRVGDVQTKARDATAALRVVALHEDASTGNAGNAAALQEARDDLAGALHDATWITSKTSKALLAEVDDLSDGHRDAESVAKDVEAAFGL